MSKRVCVITGATSGIGLATAIEMARLGFEICFVGRDPKKCLSAQTEIVEKSKNSAVRFFVADLSSVRETTDVANEILESVPRVDVLINNAGISSDRFTKTTEGLDKVYATNHLATLIFSKTLLPRIKQSPDGRIVNVSSRLHLYAQYNAENPQLEGTSNFVSKSYSQSKLLNVMTTMELSDREKTARTLAIISIHPGVVRTGITREIKSPWLRMASLLIRPFLNSPERAARNTVFAATAQDLRGLKGAYVDNFKFPAYNRQANDRALRQKAWEYSENLIEGVLAKTSSELRPRSGTRKHSSLDAQL